MSMTTLQIACLLMAQLSPTDPPPLQRTPLPSVLVKPSDTDIESDGSGTPTPAEISDPAPATPIASPVSNPSGVVTASAEVPLAGDGALGQSVSPLDLLQCVPVPAGQGEIAGRPYSLRQSLDQARNRQQQLKAIQSYWRLTVQLLDYCWSVREADYLDQIATPQGSYEQTLLQAAAAAANARRSEAELAAVAAQYDLAAAAQFTSVDSLPLPSDAPLVGPYRTHFGDLFQNRPAPIALLRIDRTLPQLLKLIRARSAAVVAAQSALLATEQAYQTGQARLESLLGRQVRLRDQRIAFLTAVRDYNSTIADYALSVAGPSLSQDEIVSMLIPTAPLTKSVLVPRRADVTPAVAEEAVGQPSGLSIPLREAAPGKLVPVEPPAAPIDPNGTATP